MNPVKNLGLDGEYKHLDSTPPPDSNVSSVMTMEAQVDTTPQELKKLRPYYKSSKGIPSNIPPEAQIVLHALCSCFERQGRIEEGIIGDLVWGFEAGGIPPACAVGGLSILEKLGYVKFQSPDSQYVDISSDQIDKCWVRYQKTLLELVYE